MSGEPDSNRWAALAADGPEIDFPFFLAPMVGLSNVALRQVAARYYPRGVKSIFFTEMLSTRRLPTERMGDRPETCVAPSETSLVPQIVGNDDEFIERSMRRLLTLRPVAIDFNLGCPVRHAFHQQWGVALMGDIKKAESVLSSVVRHSPVPVSAKIRTGLEDDPGYTIEFAKMLESVGVAWITLHPRLASEGRRGRARWEHIARVRDAVRVPVVGNGDVQTADDALQMKADTGCDGVMIGRAATARPWIFWQIGERLGLPGPWGRDGDAPNGPVEEGNEFAEAATGFVDSAETHFPAATFARRWKFYVDWASRWMSFGHELSRRLARATTPDEARDEIQDFFSRPQRMSQRTTLR